MENSDIRERLAEATMIGVANAKTDSGLKYGFHIPMEIWNDLGRSMLEALNKVGLEVHESNCSGQ